MPLAPDTSQLAVIFDSRKEWLYALKSKSSSGFSMFPVNLLFPNAVINPPNSPNTEHWYSIALPSIIISSILNVPLKTCILSIKILHWADLAAL